MHLFRNPILVAAIVAVALGGCASPSAKRDERPTVVVAVRLPDGRPPSSQQALAVQQAIAPAADRAGLRLASRAESADYLVTVSFAPDPADPTKGEMRVSRVERTPRDLNTGSASFDPKQALQQLERWGQSRSAPEY